MTLLVLTIVGAALLAAAVALVGFAIRGRGIGLNVSALAIQLEKLESAHNRSRAVKLLSVVAERHPARRLFLRMLSLQLPRRTVQGEATDYRDAPDAKTFDQVLDEALDAEALTLSAELGRAWIPAVATAATAAVTAGAGWFLVWLEGVPDDVAPEWHTASLVIAVAGLADAIFAALQWRKQVAGLRAARARLCSLLSPVEEMADWQLEGAAMARELLEGRGPYATVGKSGRASSLKLAAAVGGVAIAGVVAFFVMSTRDEPPHPIATARVTAVTGQHQVQEGTLCELRVGPSSGGFNCKVEVDCPGAPLYGTESSLGYTHCVFEGARPISGDDPQYDEGDPAMRFDMRAGVVVVRDEGWTVELTIEQVLRDGGIPDAGH